MYDRMLVVIDASPDSPDNSLNRTIQFAKMSGATVYLLHVARGHLIPADISAGSRLGVPTVEDEELEAEVAEAQAAEAASDEEPVVEPNDDHNDDDKITPQKKD